MKPLVHEVILPKIALIDFIEVLSALTDEKLATPLTRDWLTFIGVEPPPRPNFSSDPPQLRSEYAEIRTVPLRLARRLS